MRDQPPDSDRDTRLDPIDAIDATQPGSIFTPEEPLHAVSRDPRPPPRIPPPPPSIAALADPELSSPTIATMPAHQITGPILPEHLPHYVVPSDIAGIGRPPPGAMLPPVGSIDPVPPIGVTTGEEIPGMPGTQEVLYPAADSIAPPSLDGARFSDVPTTTEAFRLRAPRLKRGWPFLPIAPLLVVIVGLAVALGIGLVGLDQLGRAGDEHAGARAELLAATVAARLGALPATRRLDAAQLAARRTAAELLVVTPHGEVLHDVTYGAPDPGSLQKMLTAKRGVANVRMGRARYAVRPLGSDPESPRLVVLVPEPRAAEGQSAFLSALAALVVLLLGVAAAVAYAVSRDVTRDVAFVTDRVRTMAQVRNEPTGELIPTRTMDEVGILTATFNKLVGRFGTSEKAYRQDLARASAADRERAAFLAAISHELRSPLNAILGFADILMEEVDGPLSPSAKEEVEQIRGSGAHLLTLINDILEFSALESGQLRLSRSRADVFALAQEVVREARGLVGDKQLDVRLEGEPLVARVDARRVRQILGNLVNNAIKFTQRGEVVVRVQRRGVQVALSVRDTGPGISELDRALIFEEYKQASNERPRRRGTGLGLAITRRLVMLHHGTIRVESELGRGSTFEVVLPIGNIDAPPSRKLSGPPPGGPHGFGGTGPR